MWIVKQKLKINKEIFKGEVSLYGWATDYFLDSNALLMLDEQQFYLFGQIQTSQTGGQLYSDPSAYGACSLVWPRR